MPLRAHNESSCDQTEVGRSLWLKLFGNWKRHKHTRPATIGDQIRSNDVIDARVVNNLSRRDHERFSQEANIQTVAAATSSRKSPKQVLTSLVRRATMRTNSKNSTKHSRNSFLTVTDNLSPHNAAVVARCRHGSDVSMTVNNSWKGSSTSLKLSSTTTNKIAISANVTATSLTTSDYEDRGCDEIDDKIWSTTRITLESPSVYGYDEDFDMTQISRCPSRASYNPSRHVNWTTNNSVDDESVVHIGSPAGAVTSRGNGEGDGFYRWARHLTFINRIRRKHLMRKNRSTSLTKCGSYDSLSHAGDRGDIEDNRVFTTNQDPVETEGDLNDSLLSLDIASQQYTVNQKKMRENHSGVDLVQIYDDLMVELRTSAPALTSLSFPDGRASPTQSVKMSMRRSFRNIFAPAPKFCKTLQQSSVYACLLLTTADDKLLVTQQDLSVPITQIGDDFNIMASIQADYAWIIRTSCYWSDVRLLLQEFEKSTSTSGFIRDRFCFLNAISQLQEGTGLQDLGRFFWRPIRHSSGALLLVSIRHVTKAGSLAVNTSHVRWMPIDKTMLASVQSADEDSVTSQLLAETGRELMQYERVSGLTLSRGLYVVFVELVSSLDAIYLVVPSSLVNVLPYVRVSDNPRLSRDTWTWLESCQSTNNVGDSVQMAFRSSLRDACVRLLRVSATDDFAGFRLYANDVKVSDDVTFICVLPPHDALCRLRCVEPGVSATSSAKGHNKDGCHRDGFCYIPVNIFEIIHLLSYRKTITSQHCLLSSVLDIELHLTQHDTRKAITSDEIAACRNRTQLLERLRERLDDAWSHLRWINDVIIRARDQDVSSSSGAMTSLDSLFSEVSGSAI